MVPTANELTTIDILGSSPSISKQVFKDSKTINVASSNKQPSASKVSLSLAKSEATLGTNEKASTKQLDQKRFKSKQLAQVSKVDVPQPHVRGLVNPPNRG